MRRQAEEHNIGSIAMPKIGAGYGGLSWKKIKRIVESVFHDWDGTVLIYEEYVPEAEP
jgi:O-acetyl-ADP-ribose deacetylase (regulator of RNase III)